MVFSYQAALRNILKQLDFTTKLRNYKPYDGLYLWWKIHRVRLVILLWWTAVQIHNALRLFPLVGFSSTNPKGFITILVFCEIVVLNLFKKYRNLFTYSTISQHCAEILQVIEIISFGRQEPVCFEGAMWPSLSTCTIINTILLTYCLF